MATREQLNAQIEELRAALDRRADDTMRKLITSPWTAMYVLLYTAACFGFGFLIGSGG